VISRTATGAASPTSGRRAKPSSRFRSTGDAAAGRGRKPEDTSLEQWTEEEWGTRSGRKSLESGERYLPKAAREELSDEEYRATSRKKRRDLQRGKQHSRQPPSITEKTAKHRHDGTGQRRETTKADLYEEAKRRDLRGRSRMSKDELARALHT
jgi:hypothetical protein